MKEKEPSFEMTGEVIAILSPTGLFDMTGAVMAIRWFGSLFPEMYSNRMLKALSSDSASTVARVNEGYSRISTGPTFRTNLYSTVEVMDF
jgi:hypothetical protein